MEISFDIHAHNSDTMASKWMDFHTFLCNDPIAAVASPADETIDRHNPRRQPWALE